MVSYRVGNFTITPEKEGYGEFLKVSYPARYGRFGEIETPEYAFQFNLNGEIKFIAGRSGSGLPPQEWLKRTPANDWIYYSAGDYGGFYDLLGEHYHPCLSYPSNSLIDENPLEEKPVRSALSAWHRLRVEMSDRIPKAFPAEIEEFLMRMCRWEEKNLGRRADQLHRLIGGPVTVLPPDARHVDYELIPVIAADGCSYHCRFCRVKSGRDFSPRSPKEVADQIRNLKRFLGRDLPNYNAVFLGHHDGLRSGRELLEQAAETAYERFEFDRSHLKGSFFFLFGSADSLIRAEESLFEVLNGLPYFTYLNTGLESSDRETLALLGKPLDTGRVREAFKRMAEINRKYEKIEVTANFVFGPTLPSSHLPSIIELVQEEGKGCRGKGSVYLSPLVEDEVPKGAARRDFLKQFRHVKLQSPLPVYLCLIQRL
jgi:hypothetical protein